MCRAIPRTQRRSWALEKAVPDSTWRVAPRVLVDRLASLLGEDEGGDYPFRLICGRQERRHNRHDNVEKPKNSEAPVLRIAPADAAGLGIAEGDRVHIRSRHGEVVAAAAITDVIRPGAVHLPHGWPEANVNRLATNVEVDPLTTQPQLSAFAVALERVKA